MNCLILYTSRSFIESAFPVIRFPVFEMERPQSSRFMVILNRICNKDKLNSEEKDKDFPCTAQNPESNISKKFMP